MSDPWTCRQPDSQLQCSSSKHHIRDQRALQEVKMILCGEPAFHPHCQTSSTATGQWNSYTRVGWYDGNDKERVLVRIVHSPGYDAMASLTACSSALSDLALFFFSHSLLSVVIVLLLETTCQALGCLASLPKVDPGWARCVQVRNVPDHQEHVGHDKTKADQGDQIGSNVVA